MSVGEHKLEIFRGLIKFKSNEQKIWGVLIFLSIVTIIEVALGIIKPDFLSAYFMRMKLLNWIDGSVNFATKTKPLYIEDDYKPRKSYYDNATTAKKSKSITNNSFLFYFN